MPVFTSSQGRFLSSLIAQLKTDTKSAVQILLHLSFFRRHGPSKITTSCRGGRAGLSLTLHLEWSQGLISLYTPELETQISSNVDQQIQ